MIPDIILAADIHQDPGELRQDFNELVMLANSIPTILVLNGDTFNFQPQGTDVYKETIEELAAIRHRNGLTVFLEGNHDTQEQLAKMLRGYDNFHVHKSMDWSFRGGTIIHIEHGHRWCPLWSWGLNEIAPTVTELMLRYSPRLWDWIGSKLGWTGVPKNEEQYHAVVLSVWSHALRYCTRHNCRCITAHTHKLGGVVELYDYGLDYIVVNPAPLATGSYMEISRERMELKSL